VVLHADEVAVDVQLISRLLAEQVPDLAHLELVEVGVQGSSNAVHRLGDRLCTRLPRAERFVEDLERERRWLAHLAPYASLAVPEVVAVGSPGCGYPFPWAIYRWVDGQPYDPALINDAVAAGTSLARFVEGLRSAPLPSDAPPGGRAPLASLDGETRGAIAACAPEIGASGVEAALAIWEGALQSPVWDGRAAWVHADLLPLNLTVSNGVLHGVIDFGTVGVGDPAADVIAAWTLFGPEARAAYREGLDVDEGTWARARGYALHQAANIVWYYRHSQPGFAANAVVTIRRVLEDQPA
jgi:aminoglycoside phosphotransferase (APT) family kinase protein